MTWPSASLKLTSEYSALLYSLASSQLLYDVLHIGGDLLDGLNDVHGAERGLRTRH